MSNYILVAFAVICNVLAQVSLKKASKLDIFSSNQIVTIIKNVATNYYIVIGIILYMFSFMLTIKIYEKFELSFISPIMMAAIFILIMVLSTIIFQEKINALRILGICVIVSGIVLVTKS